ncbi:contractile injection system protein, VgrG/Pvc8 family [Kordiimonas marina]|uniref:contractile injection system protein, VgrG/Pvc8 family n=1 Tax=Kordiimonas marina TaxID=2872312 RepID=UPI001FF36D14|nr:contractile injection system protein, VgrG/Pvc8 family [Kordiimonas marina]MCJ9428533.1 hypothetical protein [Kordiimonas marina]
MNPSYRIEIDGNNLTGIFSKRLVSIDVIDNAGYDSDEVTITVTDPEGKLKLPRTGAELTLWLGYDAKLKKVGIYTVDELITAGPPRTLTVKAHAANMKASLKETKSRSFDNITLGDLVTQIAAEHSLTPVVGADLKATHFDHIDQTAESDLHLLTRLAVDLDAVAKPTHQRLVFVTRGDEKAASGQKLPTVALTPKQVSKWRATLKDRFLYKSVSAQFQDLKAAQLKTVTVGSGSPNQLIRRTYPDQDQATRAARSRYHRYARGKGKLSLSLPGRTDIFAETPLQLSEFQDGVDGSWVASKVMHRLTKTQGFSTRIEAELKD